MVTHNALIQIERAELGLLEKRAVVFIRLVPFYQALVDLLMCPENKLHYSLLWTEHWVVEMFRMILLDTQIQKIFMMMVSA